MTDVANKAQMFGVLTTAKTWTSSSNIEAACLERLNPNNTGLQCMRSYLDAGTSRALKQKPLPVFTWSLPLDYRV